MFVLITSRSLSAQTFTGSQWTALKNLAEYEAQQYLMTEIIEISKDNPSKLQLEKVFQDYDSDAGFMFILTSYSFEGQDGVVVTSMAKGAFVTEPVNLFRHLHISTDELRKLDAVLEKIGKGAVDINSGNTKWGVPETQHLQVFNERLIVDVNIDPNFFTPDYSFWIDKVNRHKMTQKSWQKAVKSHFRRIE
ncbi:MAG: hypothetical protein KDB98_09830 [Flavobacteriales bacterium]|nr:hypothetical protein [Flavobacteriales bacterium]